VSRIINTKQRRPMIFLIDDHPANLKVLSSFLRDQKFDIRIFESGKRALKILERIVPDIILLDVMMFEVDGFSICRQIKENPRTADIPVIFLTALDNVEDKVAGFEAGGADYITKPFQKIEVLSRLKTHLSLHQKQVALDRLLAERQSQNETLEELVAVRTADLQKNSEQLRQSQREIEKKNIALEVLLGQYQTTRGELENQVVTRLKKIVFPYLYLLHNDVSQKQKDEYLDFIRGHLYSIVDSFNHTVSNPGWNLTPREILVVDLVRQGKNSREIASLLKISLRTVETYRNAIRKKIGLTNKKTSLRTYLSSVLVRD